MRQGGRKSTQAKGGYVKEGGRKTITKYVETNINEEGRHIEKGEVDGILQKEEGARKREATEGCNKQRL